MTVDEVDFTAGKRKRFSSVALGECFLANGKRYEKLDLHCGAEIRFNADGSLEPVTAVRFPQNRIVQIVRPER